MGSDRRCLSPGILAALSCTLPATIMSHHWLYVTISRIYATGLRCGGYFSQAVPSEAWPEIIGLLQRLGHCYLMIRQITAEWWSTSISGLRWSGTWWSLHCYAPDIWPHCQWFLGRWIILGFGNPVGLLYKRFLIHQWFVCMPSSEAIMSQEMGVIGFTRFIIPGGNGQFPSIGLVDIRNQATVLVQAVCSCYITLIPRTYLFSSPNFQCGLYHQWLQHLIPLI